MIHEALLVRLESFNLKSLNLKLINSSVGCADTSSINRGGAGILSQTSNLFTFNYPACYTFLPIHVFWAVIEGNFSRFWGRLGDRKATKRRLLGESAHVSPTVRLLLAHVLVKNMLF